MSSTLPRVDDDVLRQRVSHGAFSRGRQYAQDGAVLEWDWDGTDVSAAVAGTSPAPYRCRITVVKVGTLWIPMAMGCSCPVRSGCKHAVAALLTVRDAPANDGEGVTWRQRLATAQVASGQEPLALGFYLRPAPGTSRWQARLEPEPDLAAAHAAGRRLNLLLRPMTRGRSGAWIRGGLTWRGLTHDLAHNHAHLMWLRQLLGVYDGTKSTTGGVDHEGLALHEIHGPMLWDLLARAGEIGVELVPDKGLSLTWAETAHVHVHASRRSGSLELRPRASVDGADLTTPWFPIGRHGLYTYERTATGFHVTIAPTTAPLPPVLTGMREPVLIPGPEEKEFFTEYFPTLHRAVPIRAAADVDLPIYRAPNVALDLTYTEGDRVHLAWSFEYHSPPASHLFEPVAAGQGGHRDPVWEREVYARLAATWPGWSAAEELSGVGAAEFTAEILPRLEQVTDLVITIVGKRPDYTKLEGHPHIRITAVESDRTDWFDLGFEVTINGRMVPYAELFSALSRGATKLLLIDRTYLDLDHPAFAELREIISRAEELPEWDPQRPRISKYQVHMWEEFEDLADETEAATAWRSAVAGLRNLDSIELLDPPADLRADLRDYQREGFSWLAFLHRNGLGGILADDMGLGKTLQTLALFAHAKAEGTTAPFLVVAPTSVVGTWLAEAAAFAPTLNVVALSATARKRRRALSAAIAGADVVVTSYAIARLDAADFAAEQWAGLVLDEAQFVKNARTRAHQAVADIPVPFRLAITGTPMENSLTDLWALMSITAPGLFPSGPRFRKAYVRPIEKNHDPDRLAALRARVRPFMLRRTKEQVAPELPAKQEQVLEVALSASHRRVYDAVLQRERQKVLGLIDDLDKNRFIVFRSLTLLRLLALAPGLTDPQHEHIASAKLLTLVERISDIAAEGHRVLVFSQFTSFLKMAGDALAEAGLEYSYLDGSTRNRASVIEGFRTGVAPVFLISLKAGGFGLTLTEADYVFMLDPWWNPAAESQAVDRTHRIGQTRAVMVYRLVARGTIEEKVLALQQRKAALFDAVVDDDAHFSSALSAEDIRALFD